MKRIAVGAAAVIAILVLGGLGMHWIYGAPWLLSLYWTLTLMTTATDARLIPRTPLEIVFTGFLLVVGTALWIFWLSVVVSAFLTIDLARKERRLMDRLQSLHHHFVVLGAGKVGQSIARELQEAGATVVVTDTDRERVEALSTSDLFVVHLPAFDLDGARRLQLPKARGLALALPDDAQNLYAYLTARDLNSHLITVARAQSPESAHHLRQLGVTRVILPDLAGGRQLGRILLKPMADELLMSLVNEEGIRVHEVAVSDRHPMRDQPVSRIRTVFGPAHTLLGFWRNGVPHMAPSASVPIQKGDVLVLVEQDVVEPDQ